MNLKLFLNLFFAFAITSCTTSKWKNSFTEKRVTALKVKYNAADTFETNIDANQFVNKMFRDLTRKDVKKNIKGWERIYALVPDSVSSFLINRTDSFYRNRQKIKYIKMNNLQTVSIHFLNEKFK